MLSEIQQLNAPFAQESAIDLSTIKKQHKGSFTATCTDQTVGRIVISAEWYKTLRFISHANNTRKCRDLKINVTQYFAEFVRFLLWKIQHFGNWIYFHLQVTPASLRRR
jgi:hypothetical protein